MLKILPKSLVELAKSAPFPLYLVGGTVRDHLANLPCKTHDYDICAPVSAEVFADFSKSQGFQVHAVYKNTGTVKLKDRENTEYEFAAFRSDKYVRGTHVPVETCFTQDIRLDSLRRDFTCNAVYFHIAKAEYVDPLGGIAAIRDKRLTTVAPAKKVFGEDGLRLLRLARQAAELGFSPDEDCVRGAKQNAELIRDVSPERIFAELSALLVADQKCGNQGGAYTGLKLLNKIGVFSILFPELALGDGMAQRSDFHNYDVLEHSFRAVLYASPRLRLAALLHDVGKPFCKIRDGNSHAHPVEGVRIATEILHRLKAPKKTVEQVCAMVELHMYDFDCKVNENKLRRFFVCHYPILQDLLGIKQADFSACRDDVSTAPTCKKWTALLAKMQKEGAPFTLKDLAVNGKDLLFLEIPPHQIASVLHALLLHAACNPKENKKERLMRLAPSFARGLN